MLDQRRPGEPALHPGACSQAGCPALSSLLPGQDCRQLRGGIQQVKRNKKKYEYIPKLLPPGGLLSIFLEEDVGGEFVFQLVVFYNCLHMICAFKVRWLF